MLRSWEHGLLFPAWGEGFYLGYGSPVFHFYASLTYYLSALLQVVTGLNIHAVLRGLIVLSFLACSSGMYLFVRRRCGEVGAVLAGLLYVYSPYLLYTEPFSRGAYPELLAFAIFPFLLWRLDALRGRPTALNLIRSRPASGGRSSISHNLMAVTLTLMALTWLIGETALQRAAINRTLVRGGGNLGYHSAGDGRRCWRVWAWRRLSGCRFCWRASQYVWRISRQ